MENHLEILREAQSIARISIQGQGCMWCPQIFQGGNHRLSPEIRGQQVEKWVNKEKFRKKLLSPSRSNRPKNRKNDTKKWYSIICKFKNFKNYKEINGNRYKETSTHKIVFTCSWNVESGNN